MNSVIVKLMINQFRIFFREPGVLFWVFGFPILMAVVLGSAFQEDGTFEASFGVVAYEVDETSHFQQWLNQLSNVQQTESKYGMLIEGILGESGDTSYVSFLLTTREQATVLIKRGVIPLFIEPEGNSITFHFDPQNSEARLNYLVLKNALLESAWPPSELKTVRLNSIGNRYIDFLIPGLMALGIMNSCIWGIGWSLIEMRMKKLLRRMIATPMKKSALLFSSFLNRLLLSSFELFVLFMFGVVMFDMEIQGSILNVILLIFCGNVAFAGIAILMSSRTESTVVGNGLINTITLPMMVLSGIFFSYQKFPEWAITIIEILPLTILSNTMRRVILEGSGFFEILMPLAILTTMGLVCALIGLKVYKWH